MLYQGEIYEEIAELGVEDGRRTTLHRSEKGLILVCKELTDELLQVYKELQKRPHPNIVQILGFCVNKEQSAVLLEYFPSVTLEEKLVQQGKLSLVETENIMLQVCSGVYSFHGLGIVHRDLKPSNILVDIHGVAKITDFGISRFYKKNQNSDTRILGTPGYAAPEQFGFAQTDERADIYSLGVLINRMLTGKLPNELLFTGELKVSSIVKQCLSMSADQRCSIEEVEAALGGRPRQKVPLQKCILKWIPGFRTGNKMHMTLAVLDYTYIGYVFISSCFLLWEGWRKLGRGVVGLMLDTLVVGWLIGSFPAASYKFNMRRGVKKALLILIYAVIAVIIWGEGLQWLT